MPVAALSGRIAIVTGASAGIGRAIARQLAQDGAGVVINARRAERLTAAAREIEGACAGARVIPVPGDCAEPSVIDSMLSCAREHLGGEADLVVVNAGRGLKGSVVDSDPAQWEDMLRTNLLGAARLMRGAAAAMIGVAGPSGGNGRPWTQHARDIIVIGSVVGRNVSPFSSMYGSTKFGVHALAEGLRRELGPKGVRVSMAAPGFVTSEFQGVAGYDPSWYDGVVERLGPVLEPADVARLVAFMAAQPAHSPLAAVAIC